MLAKSVIILIALLNGGWMLFDGIYVIRNGKYFGSVKPGPWSKPFAVFGINPFSLGSMFIIFGLIWIDVAFSLIFSVSWAWMFALVIAFSTLWYVSVGTVLAFIAIIVLLIFKSAICYS